MQGTDGSGEPHSRLEEFFKASRLGERPSEEDCLWLESLVRGLLTELETSSLLASVVEQASEAVCIFNEHGHFLYVNPAFEVLSGFTRKEVLGSSPALMNSHAQNSGLQLERLKLLRAGSIWRGLIPGRRKNGVCYVADTSIFPIRDKAGHLRNFVSFAQDVAVRLQEEQEMRNAQKMQAIGTLAGGIAHDFNNILMSLMGYAEMAKRSSSSDPKTSKHIDKIIHASQRAKQIVDQIMLFSRSSVENPKPLQVAGIAREALSLLEATLPSRLRIEADLPDCPLVMADPSQLYQVLINLFTNAVQAMGDEGGILSVSLASSVIPAGGLPGGSIFSALPGNYVCVTVRDSGPGIPPSLLSRIFEPFFTTKEIGRGSGLGLAVVHGIIGGLGGDIVVESSPGQGTVFHIHLPVADKSADSAVTIEESFADAVSTGAPPRVLLVDDDEMLLEVGKYMLDSLGCEPVLARTGSEALEILTGNAESFSLVLLDHNLTDTKGITLAPRIVALSPSLPVVLCTGSLNEHGEKPPPAVREIVCKPVDLQRLEEIIKTYVRPGKTKGQSSGAS